MADVKISGLPASTTPLAGTEVLPIVQGGATKQVSIANVTAGRAIAATSITTDTYKAASSSGGALQNSGGTPQLQWGAGGGNNLSVDVAININPANAAVAISPTGTGTVAISPAGALTINPTAASTINNTSIGAATASTGRFTTVTSTIATGTAPLVVASTTEVANLRSANATSADTANQVKSNATTGVLQVAGPGTGTTRVMTTPDANFTAARTDAGQTFTGNQAFSNDVSTVGNTYLATTSTNKFGVGTSSIANGKYQIGVGGEGGVTFNGVNNRPWFANGLNIGAFNTTTSSLFVNTQANTGGDASYNSGFGVDGTFDGNRNSIIRVLGLGVRASTYFGNLSFCTNSGTTITEGLRIVGETNNVNIPVGNLVIGTSGKGIDFSATAGTGTSELLADYEEGTFTPGIAFNNAAVDVTYSTQDGIYTKVGRCVTFTVNIVLTNKGSSTGNMTVTGLPFTSIATHAYGTSFADWYDFNFAAINPIYAKINPTNTNVSMFRQVSAGTVQAITDAQVLNSTQLKMSGFYFV